MCCQLENSNLEFRAYFVDSTVRRPRVRIPAWGFFAVVCLEAWSWELQRPHLKACSFAVM
eukprot:4701496-Prymnesium_polylepis.1